jgi:restriction endonuclease
MNERIDQFCENLRVKLTSIDDNMRALKAKIDSKERTVDQDVQFRLDSIKKRIGQDRAKLEAAHADIKKWAEERKGATDEKIAEWKAKLEKAKLNGRAEAAERYAAGAVVVALAALDDAEQASLEAWLARKDADSAQSTKAA